MKKERVKSRSGITLIALVVTIVVLLILAGITIATLFGENGIINAARRAEQETARDKNTTNEGIKNLEGQMADIIDNSSLKNLIDSNSFVTSAQGNQVVKDRTGKSMIVPVGFKITSDSSNEIDKGVVIEDKEHNEYVWVPVSDSQFSEMFGSNDSGSTTNYFGKLYKFGSTTDKGNAINKANGYREPDSITQFDGYDATYDASYFKAAISETMISSEFQAELQSKFNEMAKSVKEYKGFYIGRYEASSLNTSNPKTIRGVIPSTNINWYNTYKNMQGVEICTNSDIQSDVKTNMIWGCQWDRTLDWIANTNSNIGYSGIVDSRDWGNYFDSESFEYTKEDGTTGTKTNKAGTLTPTGSTERNKANNIYDLAGNLCEWTMEASVDVSRIGRGGDYRSSGAPSFYRHIKLPYYIGNDFGSRPTLYVAVP